MSHVLRECGITIGRLTTGKTNSLTDVPGVLVGHATVLAGKSVRTGVTAIRPHSGNLYQEKVKAAAVTLNGFGKPVGFPQVNELGTIETPVVLTNTLSVGTAADAIVAWSLSQDETTDQPITSLNPVVAECNDSYLNDIRSRVVGADDVLHAIETAAPDPVAEGCCGAGTGMSAFEFKSGIGSASRLVGFDGESYTVGVLSVPNFGYREELILDGVHIGERLREYERGPREEEAGSIVIVLASDLPLSHRQLTRIARRAWLGIARTGGTCHHGSGEFVIAFSTANRVPSDRHRTFVDERRLIDSHCAIDDVFQAVIESVEESIHCALFSAQTAAGRDGHRRATLPIAKILPLFRADGSLN